MSTAIRCKHCGQRPVETVKNAWYIEGFLLESKIGASTFIGCSECARAHMMDALSKNGAKGWFAVPWGIGTPVALVQNLWEVFRGNNEEALRQLIRKRGMMPDDLETTADGTTKAEVRLIQGVLTTLHGMAWSDGAADDQEVELGIRIARSMLGGLVDEDLVRRTLTNRDFHGNVDTDALDLESRAILFRAAADIATVDGVLHEGEVAALRALGKRLRLPGSLVDRLLKALRMEMSDLDLLRREAAAVLGVEPDAPLCDVKLCYLENKLNASGTDEEVAALHANLLRAYETLIGAAPPD